MNAILVPTKSRILSALLGLSASAAFLASGPTVHAGTKELAALNAQLATQGVTVTTATSAQLAAAVVFFTTPANNPTKLNPGIIAGEALKGATPFDAGAQIGAALVGKFPVAYSTKILDQNGYMSAAIKTTGAGKGATVAQVPGFTASLYTAATANQTKPLAILVKSTKGAAAAVLQGGASLLGSGPVGDAAKGVFARDAVADKALASVIMEATRGVAITVEDAVLFTNTLVGAPANAKNLLKIIPGIAAGQPTKAGDITVAAFGNPLYAPQGSKSPIVKGAASLAKSIGAVADIEQIQKVGAAIAAQIPITTVQSGKTVPNIKLSAATSIASTLAKAIAAKPFPNGIGVGPNRTDNRADELGELAAYMIGAFSTSAEFTATKVVKGATVAANADKIVTALLKAVVTGGKALKVGAKGAPPTKTDVATYTTLLARYVAGSVALTVSNLPSGTANETAIKNSIITALTKTGFAKSVAGASNEVAVMTAINDGLAGGIGGRFENGFDLATGALTDPETNIRNF